jgi:hypothetical protein
MTMTAIATFTDTATVTVIATTMATATSLNNYKVFFFRNVHLKIHQSLKIDWRKNRFENTVPFHNKEKFPATKRSSLVSFAIL